MVVVVGLPLSLDGSRGPAAVSAVGGGRRPRGPLLAEHGHRRSSCSTSGSPPSPPIRPWPPAGPRERDRRHVVDQTAATVMLTAWLDRPGGRDRDRPDGDLGSTARRRPDPTSSRQPASPAEVGGRRTPTSTGAEQGDGGAGGGRRHRGPLGRYRPPVADRRAGLRRGRGLPSSWAAYLWVNSRPIPAGPPGAQVIVTVGPGSGADQLAATLEAKGVIGSSLAYRIWSQFHSIPGRPGRCLRLPPEHRASRAVDRGSSPPAPTSSRSTSPRASPWRRWPSGSASCPGHTQPAFAALATGGDRALAVAAGGLDQPRRAARHGDLRGRPRRRPTTSCSTDMIDRFDTQADRARPGRRLGPARAHARTR